MQTETIIFGSGCFWCTEAIFQMLQGVTSVVSGYAGGKTDHPTYYKIIDGNTEHAEVIKVEFDPTKISLPDLLAVFFSSHDPTTLNRQGHDVGNQYRSIILYTQPEQKNSINHFIQDLTQNKTFSAPIVTEVKPLSTFYPAETNHQNFYQNNQEQPYCQVVINPKINKLRTGFAHLLKPRP